MDADTGQLVGALVLERTIRRRAQRVWRVMSFVAGVGLGLFAWPLGLAAFLFFQFLVYATYWHSTHSIEARTGLTSTEQAILFHSVDNGTAPHPPADWEEIEAMRGQVAADREARKREDGLPRINRKSADD